MPHRLFPPYAFFDRLHPKKTFRLNGFNIKRFTHPYYLRVLF